MLSTLTEVEVRRAKATEKPVKLFDGGGLFLLVKPNGARLWRMKYRVAGREKLLSFGAYPEVPLRSAREQRDEARRLIAAGIDPGQILRIPMKLSSESVLLIMRRSIINASWLTTEPVPSSQVQVPLLA